MKSINAILYSFILFSILAILVGCELKEGRDSSAIGELELLEDKEYPALNKELIIDIKGDSIAGYALIANGESKKETVILIAGYPGNDNNFDVAQEIRRKGKNVIHFNHRGAWGSQGTYTYSNCLEDISEIIEYLSQSEISNKLKIDTTGFILLGRSYGGGIALIAGSQLNKVKKIISISSVNYGELLKKYDTLEELANFKKYMKKQIMINTNIDRFLQELLDKKLEFDVVSYKNKLKDKEILLIEDSRKNEPWINNLVNIEYVVLDSDHNFINNRLELINLITDWINK